MCSCFKRIIKILFIPLGLFLLFACGEIEYSSSSSDIASSSISSSYKSDVSYSSSIANNSSRETLKNYFITYNLHQGNFTDYSTDSYYVFNENTPSFVVPTPVREGYEFTGWVEGEQIADSGIIDYMVDTSIKSDLYLSACWKKDYNYKYTITYELRGGICENNPSTYTYNTPDFKLNNPTKAGYTFVGWDKWYDDNDDILSEVIIKKGSEGNLYFVAQWVETNNGICIWVTSNTVAEWGACGTEFTNKINTSPYIIEGKVLEGFVDDNGKMYYDSNGDRIQVLWYNVKLHPIYVDESEKQYCVYFDPNGGTGNQITKKGVSGTTFTLPDNSFVKEGYTFVGWGNAQNDNAKYAPGYSFTISNNNVTLYAIWVQNGYYITFNANGGKGYMANQLFKQNETQQLTSNGFSRIGYNFSGWSLTPTSDIEYNDKDSYLYTSTSNVILYAKWEPIIYNIIYDLQGGINNSSNPATYTIESDSITIQNPTKSGYIFKGWKYGNNTTSNSIPKGSMGNKTYIATWNAENNRDDDNFVYSLKYENYEITKYNGSMYDLIIPCDYKGIKITSIGEKAFSGCTSLTSITISDSVTSIEEHAFAGCTSLTSITIPDSVTSIGSFAFASCTSLTSITLPKSLTSIGDRAFYGCRSLASATLPNSVASIGEFAFCYCESLTSITIPNSVTGIAMGTFAHCTSLRSVTISYGVNWISTGAFYNCYNLTSIIIPDSVTRIDDGVFYNCESLIIYTNNEYVKQWAIADNIKCEPIK